MNSESVMKFLPIMVVLLLVSMVIVGCVSQPQNTQKNTTTVISKNTSVVAENKTGQEQVHEAVTAILADGTYNTEATYQQPVGEEKVNFSITVKDDVVTGVSVASATTNPISAKKIEGFSKALPDLVIGKKINELDLPKNVGGSSLTNAAFKEYVDNLVSSNQGN